MPILWYRIRPPLLASSVFWLNPFGGVAVALVHRCASDTLWRFHLKVKVTSSERFTFAAKDYHAGDELDIPDGYAAAYVEKGYVKQVKAPRKRKSK